MIKQGEKTCREKKTKVEGQNKKTVPISGKHKKLEALQNGPEFKPGKKPWVIFGDERLNWGVDWQKTVQDILDAGYEIGDFTNEMELTIEGIESIVAGDISPLNFKLGARLRGIEERFYPERISVP
jgi:hypothetical protein